MITHEQGFVHAEDLFIGDVILRDGKLHVVEGFDWNNKNPTSMVLILSCQTLEIEIVVSRKHEVELIKSPTRYG